METAAGTILFNGYKVNELIFKPKIPAAGADKEQLPTFAPVFSRKIEGNDQGECRVTLSASVGAEDDAMPFTAFVSLTGSFFVPEKEQARELMEVNGTAILFPYLRAVMSQLTAAANIPQVILPTVNLVQLLNKRKSEQTED